MPTAQKEAMVRELSSEFRAAQSLVFADYRGLDVEAISELRRRCRQDGVRFRVAKNTLSRLAMSELGMTELGALLEGPTGLALSREDELAAARVLVGFARENAKLQVKGGVMEGRVISSAEVMALATLPSREQLLAQILSVVESPLVGVLRMASSLVQDVLSCAEQVAEGAAAPGGGVEAAVPDGAEGGC